MHIEVIEQYEDLKDKVELIQQGDWQSNSSIANMPVVKVQSLVELYEDMKEAGFDTLLTIYRNHFRRSN